MPSKTLLALSLAGALTPINTGAQGAPPAPARGLEDLAWIAGRWAGPSGDLEMEELWTEPKGGLMLGLHRDVSGGVARSFEFLRIESTPEGIVYRSSPNGVPATTFKLVLLEGQRAVFENPTHDFPTRILYWLADGQLHARIEGEQGGKLVGEEWTWRRVEH